MKIVLLSIGEVRDAWSRKAIDEYVEKLSRFFATEVVFLKPAALARKDKLKKLELESEQLRGKIKDKDFVVLCDERGEEMTSTAFSSKLSGMMSSGKNRIVFVIGGAFGVDETLKELAHWRWSLSRLTFNHLVAHVVALEQIYRALTISRGMPYHNQ